MKLLAVFLLTLHSALALTADDAGKELTDQNWSRNDALPLKKFGETSDLRVFQKEIQTAGFGKKTLLSIIDGDNNRVWFGSHCKLIYVGPSKIRGVGYFSLTGSLHLMGRDFSLAADVKELSTFTEMIELVEINFASNPFLWTTSCVAPNHFAPIKDSSGKKVEDIKEENGILVMVLSAEGVGSVSIPLAFDHSNDQCSTAGELQTARSSEQAYPGGFFGWKRGQPEDEFDFQFDEKLDAKLEKLLEPNN